MLAKKEAVAVVLLVIAFVCIVNAAWIGNVNPIMSSPERLTQKIVSVGTAYICLIYALSTWFYHSNYSEPRQHIRIVFLGMLVVLIIANCVVAVQLVLLGLDWSRNGSLDKEKMFTEYEWVCDIIAIVLILITVLLLLIVFIYLLFVTINKQKDYASRRQG